MNVILFEDEHVQQLYPITVGRPALGITCGSYRLIELIERWGATVSYVVRPHLRAIVAADYPATGRLGPNLAVYPASEATPNEPASVAPPGPVVLINAALVPSVSALERLRQWAKSGRPGVVRVGTQIAAAIVSEDHLPESRQMAYGHFHRYLAGLQLPETEADLSLFIYPHDVVRHHLRIMGENLDHRLAHGEYREVSPGVFLAEGAELGQYTVTETRRGPIVLEAGGVGPHCYLIGPVHLGRAARVIEQSAIKDAVSLGHTTKVGGEVEAAIIEPYTNKQHHGFLGHSYLGSWINLGAGTCNSDLKNTYGEVNMEYDGRKVPTGMQFIGCIMGDYAKSAINTAIFTGKVVGAGSMLYGFVTTNVPSFVNYARTFGQVTEIPAEVLILTQARMFERRNVTQRPCDTQLLHDMHALTRHERQIAGEPLVL